MSGTFCETFGVVCGQCGGPGYFETCRQSRPTDHDFAIAFECPNVRGDTTQYCTLSCPPSHVAVDVEAVAEWFDDVLDYDAFENKTNGELAELLVAHLRSLR